MGRRAFYVLMVCFLAGSYGIVLGQSNAPVRPGDLVYKTDFNQGKGLTGWEGPGKLEKTHNKGSALSVYRSEGPAGNAMVSQISIPCEKYRGCLLMMSGMVKGEKVRVGVPTVKNTLTHETIKTSYHAIKFMVTVGNETYQAAVAVEASSPRGDQGYKDDPAAKTGGTFDWKPAAVRVFVPWDAEKMTIALGLEASVTGKVWFDDVKIQVRQVDAFPKGKVPMGPWKFPRLRGTMIDPRALTEADYKVLGGEWKANLVRWCFHAAPAYASSADDAAYDKWLDGEIKRLDTMLPILRKYGIYAVVAMFGAPGGGGGWEGSPLYTNPACQKKVVEVWRKLATHYKGVHGIFGYDPVNEPCDILGIDNVGYDTVPGNVYDWWELSDRISRAIREIDSERLILIEPSPCVPYEFYRYIPLNISNIVYSPHMYMPYQFTHQFVFPCFNTKLGYPGFEWGDQIWDRNRIRAELQHVVNFQQKWGARIYVGEFSAVRWAPGAYDYIKDVIDVFEEHGWDWTYHAFREHPCWGVEYDEGKDADHLTRKVTDRQKLLMKWFSKN